MFGCLVLLVVTSGCSLLSNDPCRDATTLAFLTGVAEANADARALLTQDPELLAKQGLTPPLTPDDIKEKLIGYQLNDERIAQVMAKKAVEGDK